jgi:hypothetical protein
MLLLNTTKLMSHICLNTRGDNLGIALILKQDLCQPWMNDKSKRPRRDTSGIQLLSSLTVANAVLSITLLHPMGIGYPGLSVLHSLSQGRTKADRKILELSHPAQKAKTVSNVLDPKSLR